MSNNVYQLTQLPCQFCGQNNVQPKTEQYYDKYTQETVVEAVWQCPRCGNKINSGEISRTKNEKSK